MKTMIHLAAGLSALVSLIQPCPAPAVAIVGVHGGMIINAGKVFSGDLGFEAGKAGKDVEELADSLGFIGKRDVGMTPCIEQLYQFAGAIRFESRAVDQFTIHHVPAVCKDDVKAWNSRHNITALNHAIGRLAWLDSTNAFHMTEIPAKLQPHVKKAMDAVKQSPKQGHRM